MKKSTLFFLCVFISFAIHAQDVFFTSLNQSLIFLNPSYAGSNGGIRNQSLIRYQWPNSFPSYKTSINTFDAYIPSIKGGVSVMAMRDDQGNGILVTGGINVGYAQYLSLANGKIKLVPSLQVGYSQMRLDLTKLNFGDALNSRYNEYWSDNGFVPQWGSGLPASRANSVNLNSGLLIYFKNFTGGISLFNMLRPDIGLYGSYYLPVRTCLHAAYTIPIKEDLFVSVNSLYNNQQQWQSWQLSPILSYKKVFVGGGIGNRFIYSGNNTVYTARVAIITAGLHFQKMNLCYSFDTNVNQLGTGKKNSHEFSISFNFKSKKDSVSRVGMQYW